MRTGYTKNCLRSTSAMAKMGALIGKRQPKGKGEPQSMALLWAASLAAACCLVTAAMSPVLAAPQHSFDLAKQVMTQPAVPIDADNSEPPPLTVTYAGVKAITGDEYAALTGNAAGSDHYVSFPRLEVSNNSTKKITEFDLMIQDKRNPTHRVGLIVHNRAIEPLSKREFRSELWRPEPMAVKSSSEGTEDVSRAAVWSSPGMWLAGSAGDFVVTVASVRYEDGSEWVTSR